jgi:hypothetical protein
MTRRNTPVLPAFLASPMLADRVAVEITEAAAAVTGDGPMATERRGFLAAVAVQVEAFGTTAVSSAANAEPAQYRPSVVRDDVETRDAG